MSEWSTDRLSDFLRFTSSTYFRLFELSNRGWWPLQLVLVAAGLLTVYYVTHRGKPVVYTAAGMLFGFIWIWVGWEFHWIRYAPVMLAAPYFAGAFVLQGVALSIGSPFLTRPAQRRPLELRFATGLILLGFFVQPALLVLGRPLAQMQVFGIAPDPTATVTLGMLFLLHASWTLFVIPILWCLISAATLSTLHVPDTWPVLGVAIISVAGLLSRRFAR